MKKYLIYLWGLILLFTINVKAYEKDILNLDNPIISFERLDKFGLQGFTIINNNLFMIIEGNDDTESIVKVYDLDNYKEIVSYSFGSLGHANDVTYNSKNNTIYVIAGDGSKTIYSFRGDNYEYIGKLDIEFSIRSISYLEDLDKYAVRTITNGFILDNEFQITNRFPFVMGLNINRDIGRQGWAYYNKRIYYANWSWTRLGGDGANIIYIYDLDGKRYEPLYTSKEIGEIEDIAFYKDKMIIGFNSYNKSIDFYMIEVPNIRILESKKDKVIEGKEKSDKKVIIILSILGIFLILIGSFIVIKKRDFM